MALLNDELGISRFGMMYLMLTEMVEVSQLHLPQLGLNRYCLCKIAPQGAVLHLAIQTHQTPFILSPRW